MTVKDELRRLITIVAGNNPKRRAAVLRTHSAFTPDDGDGTEKVAEDLDSMSERWAAVTRDRLKKALREGLEWAVYDEHGNRVQHHLFGDSE